MRPRLFKETVASFSKPVKPQGWRLVEARRPFYCASRMKNSSENAEKKLGGIWESVVLPVIIFWGLWFFALLLERLGK
jgi:hypothetical protein